MLICNKCKRPIVKHQLVSNVDGTRYDFCESCKTDLDEWLSESSEVQDLELKTKRGRPKKEKEE